MLKSNIKKVIIGALFILLCCSNSYAAHHFTIDDTGTQGNSKVQLEFNSEFSCDNANGDKNTENILESVISYGINENIDLVVEIPFQWFTTKTNGLTTADENGLGDMGFEVKWRFLENEAEGLSFALKPAITIPTGNENKGLGDGKVSKEITVIATHEGKLGKLHANLGYSHHQLDRAKFRNNLWHASLATEINTADKLRSVINIGVDTNEDKTSSTHPLFLLGGLIYSVSDKLDFDCGINVGLNSTAPDTTLLAGVAIRW